MGHANGGGGTFPKCLVVVEVGGHLGPLGAGASPGALGWVGSVLSRSEALVAVDPQGSRGWDHIPLEEPQVLRLAGNGGSGFQEWGSCPQGSEMVGMLLL